MPTLRVLGSVVEVDLDGSFLDEGDFRHLWSRCLVDDQPPTVTVSAGQRSMESLTQAITRAAIGSRRGELLMLHAGAVAHPETGRALAFVAPGGTGKSSLARLLGREYGYLTDETVAFDPHTLEIHPYPKPVTWAPKRSDKVENAPEDMGLLHAPPRPVLGHVIVLRRQDSRAATFTELGVLDAIQKWVPESSSIYTFDRPLHLLADIYDRVGCTLVEYGEADDILPWCRERLEAL